MRQTGWAGGGFGKLRGWAYSCPVQSLAACSQEIASRDFLEKRASCFGTAKMGMRSEGSWLGRSQRANLPAILGDTGKCMQVALGVLD